MKAVDKEGCRHHDWNFTKLLGFDKPAVSQSSVSRNEAKCEISMKFHEPPIPMDFLAQSEIGIIKGCRHVYFGSRRSCRGRLEDGV